VRDKSVFFLLQVINVGDEYQAHVELKADYGSSDKHCDDREGK
jgi:hypothetical protein